MKRNLKIDNIEIFIVAIFWTVSIYLIIWHLKYFIGVDAYYHVEISEIMKQYSLVLKSFPWADCSIWKENFFDKDWLFHIYLIPFLVFGKFTGGKIAILTAVFMACLAWGWLLKILNIRNKFFYLIFMFSCIGFVIRLTMCRGHLLSIILLPVCLIFIVERRKTFLFIITVIYSLSYAGAWQIIPIAFIYDLLFFIKEKKRFKITESIFIYVFSAMILSLFINPYFPNNIYGLFVQNFIVLKAKWLGIKGVEFDLGRELNPMTDRRLFSHFFFYIVLLIITFGFFIKKYKEQNFLSLFFCLLSIIYFFLSMFSIKFSDYSVPLAFVFIALFWNNWIKEKKRNRIYRKIFIVCTIGILVFVCLQIYHYSNITPLRNNLQYYGVTEWLNKNIKYDKKNGLKPETIVFSAGWSNTPMLFYGAPQCRYLVFLDPCFMYVYSPEKYKLWYKISEGKSIFPIDEIKKYFKAEYIFLTKDRESFDAELRYSSKVKLVYIGNEGEKLYRIY